MPVFSDLEEAINVLPVIHFLIISVATHGWRFILWYAWNPWKNYQNYNRVSDL